MNRSGQARYITSGEEGPPEKEDWPEPITLGDYQAARVAAKHAKPLTVRAAAV